jgi:hypothetical protein
MNFQQQLKEADNWLSESDNPTLLYLRVIFIRARPGMSDFLVKFSLPSETAAKPKLYMTRGAKGMNNAEGLSKLATSIIDKFKESGDKSLGWETVNAEHLGQMMGAELKFFAQNPNTDMLRFVTEALA